MLRAFVICSISLFWNFPAISQSLEDACKNIKYVERGVNITDAQLAIFEKGKSSIEDVVKVLGDPSQDIHFNGARLLIYRYGQAWEIPDSCAPIAGELASGRQGKVTTTGFTFDKDGVFTSVSSHSTPLQKLPAK